MTRYQCELLNVSRSGYYKYLKAADARKERARLDAEAGELIKRAFSRRGLATSHLSFVSAYFSSSSWDSRSLIRGSCLAMISSCDISRLSGRPTVSFRESVRLIIPSLS